MQTKTQTQTADASQNRKKYAYYEESNDSSNYANPLYITHYPDGSTHSTMQESVARETVNKFNSGQANLINHADKLAEALRETLMLHKDGLTLVARKRGQQALDAYEEAKQ